MKKITKIEIENSRAYYDRLTFSMEKGENVLLYGENGSGKTSLYKSLNDFIQSFYSHVSYTTNRYKPAGVAGEVILTIGDYNDITGEVDNIVKYRYAEGVDNTSVAGTAFLKSLALTKGFLNYKDLRPRPSRGNPRSRRSRSSPSTTAEPLSSAGTSPRRSSRPSLRPSRFPNLQQAPSARSTPLRTTTPRRPRPAQPLRLWWRSRPPTITAPSPKCPPQPSVRAAS